MSNGAEQDVLEIVEDSLTARLQDAGDELRRTVAEAIVDLSGRGMLTSSIAVERLQEIGNRQIQACGRIIAKTWEEVLDAHPGVLRTDVAVERALAALGSVSKEVTLAVNTLPPPVLRELAGTFDFRHMFYRAEKQVRGAVRLAAARTSLPADSAAAPSEADLETRVFIVHGRDEDAKTELAGFLHQLSIEAVILHEQPSQGRTIIEKLEMQVAKVGFAVVLLTPDDEGRLAEDPDGPQPRARQNVILELGLFVGALGRERVCALRKSDVEIPSDYSGVVYIDMDGSGSWKAELARELIGAGFEGVPTLVET